MLRWSYYFISQCSLLTPDNAEAAAHTFLVNYGRFELLGTGNLLHLDSIKGTFIDAILAAGAGLLIDDSQVAAGCQQVKSLSAGERIEYLAAAGTAKTDAYMDKSGFLIGAYNIQGLFQGIFLQAAFVDDVYELVISDHPVYLRSCTSGQPALLRHVVRFPYLRLLWGLRNRRTLVP